jgi:hypothetical protein
MITIFIIYIHVQWLGILPTYSTYGFHGVLIANIYYFPNRVKLVTKQHNVFLGELAPCTRVLFEKLAKKFSALFITVFVKARNLSLS